MTWTDDFERVDGPVGDDWVIGPYATNAGPLNEALSMFTIDDGAAVGPGNLGIEPRDVASMVRAVPTPAADQGIEIEVDDFWQTGDEVGFYFEIFNFVNMDDIPPSTNAAPRRTATMSWDGSTLDFSAYTWTSDGSTSDGSTVFGYTPPTGVLTFRLDSSGDGHQVVTFNGDVVIDYTDTDDVGGGTGQGFYGSWFAGVGVTAPRVLSVNGSAGIARKISWVSGWRTGAETGEVSWSDVNTGPADIWSAQAAIVVETLAADSPPTEGDLAIGGITNPFTGQIYSAQRLPGSDPNAPVDPVWIFTPGGS